MSSYDGLIAPATSARFSELGLLFRNKESPAFLTKTFLNDPIFFIGADSLDRSSLEASSTGLVIGGRFMRGPVVS